MEGSSFYGGIQHSRRFLPEIWARKIYKERRITWGDVGWAFDGQRRHGVVYLFFKELVWLLMRWKFSGESEGWIMDARRWCDVGFTLGRHGYGRGCLTWGSKCCLASDGVGGI